PATQMSITEDRIMATGRRIASLTVIMLALVASRVHAAGPQLIEQATVRLTVRLGNSIDFASGTIIERKGSQGIIATCAHFVSETRGNAPIGVEVIGGSLKARTTGKVLAYDDNSDACLVYADGLPDVVPIALASAAHEGAVGDTVTVAGCDEGGPVS